MSGASERANGRARGPVLQSVFLAVIDHSALWFSLWLWSVGWRAKIACARAFNFLDAATSRELFFHQKSDDGYDDDENEDDDNDNDEYGFR